MQNKIGDQFYFVAAGRQDKTSPKLVKAFGAIMFFLPEDAAKYAIEKEKELGLEEGTLKVFSAIAYTEDTWLNTVSD